MNRKKTKATTANRDGREKKLTDSPRFEDEAERKGAEVLEGRGFPKDGKNRHLWADPRHPNEARQQVKGGSEIGFTDAGERPGEAAHGFEPAFKHYGHSTGEIHTHQDAIIDKHSKKARMFEHKDGEKESYALAPESRHHKTHKN